MSKKVSEKESAFKAASDKKKEVAKTSTTAIHLALEITPPAKNIYEAYFPIMDSMVIAESVIERILERV